MQRSRRPHSLPKLEKRVNHERTTDPTNYIKRIGQIVGTAEGGNVIVNIWRSKIISYNNEGKMRTTYKYFVSLIMSLFGHG